MHWIQHSSVALAVFLTVPLVACAGVEPSSESNVTVDSSSSTAAVPDAGERARLVRPALTRDPHEYSTKELMERGYMPRPDSATMPAAYEAWLKSASKPMTLITPVTHETDMDNPNEISGNWSGIVNNKPTGGYSYAQGRWTVPSVTADPSTDTSSSSWVGLDGWTFGGGNDVWQTGTAQSVLTDGTTDYYAWVQFFPYQHEQRIDNFAVSPGDVITGAVAIVDSAGTMTNAGQVPMYILSNDTTGISTGWQVWGSVAPGQIAGGSAEWIVERPGQGGGTTSLANFGMAAFDNMEYADDAGLHIGMDLSTSIAVAMVNPANNHVLAQTFEVTDSLAWIYFFAPN